MATGSLVLKISADLTSFQRELRKMTRQVSEAANQVSELGKKLSVGITLPVTIAGAALLKMAADNERAANRMRTVFGPAVDGVQRDLDRLARTMPLAGTELQNMATRLNIVAKDMGFAAPAAAKLSTSVMALANDLAAYADVAPDSAVEALTKAMQGQTKGLQELGINLGEAEIKQTAYRLGILRTGETLTPAGKALAAYAALVERSGTFAGAAAARAETLQGQMALLRVGFAEVADKLANAVAPAFRVLLSMLGSVKRVLESFSPTTLAFVAGIAGVAAVIGPALIMLAKLTQAVVVLRAAVILLTGAGGIGGLLARLGALATNPVILSLAALAGAVGAAYLMWRKMNGAVDETKDAADAATPHLAALRDLMREIGKTSERVESPIDAAAFHASTLTTAFDRAVKVGDRYVETVDRIGEALRDVGRQLQAGVGGSLNDLNRLAAIYDQLRSAKESATLMASLRGGGSRAEADRATERASRWFSSGEQIRRDVADSQAAGRTQLRTREMALQMIQVFPVVRLAAVELKESFLRTVQDFEIARESFKQAWQRGNIGAGIGAGMKQALTPFVSSLTPASLAAAALGRVLEGMRQVIEPISNMLGVFGKVIGIMVTPILKALFPVLKVVGEVLTFLGEIIARVSAGIATGVGRLLVGIGKLLNLLPGSIGNPIIRVGKSLLSYASDQYAAASALKQARKDIRALQWSDTTDAVGQLGDAARETAEALLNVPTGFRIALERYRSQAPYMPLSPSAPVFRPSPAPMVPGGGGGAPAPGGAPPPMQVVVPLVLDGKVIARAVLQNFQRAAQQQAGSSTDWSLVQAI